MSDLTLKQRAEEVAMFLETPLGETLLTELSVQYNQLHQAAESEQLTLVQKALKVERAAGVKYAIDWFTSQVDQLEAGLLEEPKEADDKQS